MQVEYLASTVKALEESFHRQNLFRPFRRKRYEPGDKLDYDILTVSPARHGRARLEVERFAGGGFAGQVYKARLLEVESAGEPLEGLVPGRSYALKILIPAKGFARFFRGMMYGLGFQNAFSPQVNPDACRAGALWQKLIRRGAALRLGSEEAVVDIYATLLDPRLRSSGELSEWVEGRLWRFEVDDNLDARRKWKAGRSGEAAGSPEYRAKKTFMAQMVRLMRDMGATELARQYEWWSAKSQPNALKRLDSDPDPEKGLTAVDFRAGLALLPFLPQSPVDFKLILMGIGRGSLVQFDRGNLKKLRRFMEACSGKFTDLEGAVSELEEKERAYHDSEIDVSHHHVRLLASPRLWKAIRQGRITGWRTRNLLDDRTEGRLRRSAALSLLFFIFSLIPLLGRFIIKLSGRQDYRKHLRAKLTRFSYLRRAVKGRIAETLIAWLRSGRVSDERALRLNRRPWRFAGHLPLAWLPPKLHRFFSDKAYAAASLRNIFVRPFRLYFNPQVREDWLRQMVGQGRESGILSAQESSRILSQIKEPFIQKYLKSLAVHVLTLPLTQIVSVALALTYVRLHPELSWQEASLHAGLILGLFQVIPISPGSLARGLYTTFLVLKERNLKDYSLALGLSYFKYIGYLAFPIQMAYRYPDLARFMAGHWATQTVHIVPVFGERGALLEHAVFDLFYNKPLTIRRRIRKRQEKRAGKKTRYAQAAGWVLAGVTAFAALSVVWAFFAGRMPGLGDIWGLAVWIPFFTAAFAARGAGRASIPRRVLLGGSCAGITGAASALVTDTALRTPLTLLGRTLQPDTAPAPGGLALSIVWHVFIFTLLGLLGALLAETRPVKE